jgi:hypothetical protein
MKKTKKNETEIIALKALAKHCGTMTSLARRGLADEKKTGKPSAKTLRDLKKGRVEMGKLILALRRAS